MEEIYVNVKFAKHGNPVPSTNRTGPRSSKKSFHLGAIVFLGLLSVFLLIGLIMLGVYYHDSAADLFFMTEERDLLSANLSTMSDKLASLTEERDLLNGDLSAMNKKLSSMTEERDLLHTNFTEKTKELERLRCLFKENKTCPAGWRMFSCSCYLLSERSGSWDSGRSNCRDKGADLIVIDSLEEQSFLSTITNELSWIGLNDKEEEGKWKWVDGSSLTLKYWARNQPDNRGNEDCAHIGTNEKRTWNDLSCSSSLKWICEKIL